MIPLKKYYNRLTSLVNDQKGASIVLVAILLIVLMSFASLSVDAGALYKTRRDMVTAADAAALAGAKAYLEYMSEQNVALGDIDAEAAAKSEARLFAKNNKADESLVEVDIKDVTYDTHTRKAIVVKAVRNQPYYFARIFNSGVSKDVSATAVATFGYIKGVAGGDLLPLFTLDIDYNLDNEVTLHYGKLLLDDEVQNGNWGFFLLGNDNDWKDALKGDYLEYEMSVENPEESMTGGKTSLMNCIEERMQRTANGTATMYGLVPVIDSACIYDITGSKLGLPIKYFAVYKIEDVIKSEIKDKGNIIGGIGSVYADCDNSVETPAKHYDGYYEQATVIGRFTGDTIDVEEMVMPGDQDNPNPGGDPPASYIKLIE